MHGCAFHLYYARNYALNKAWRYIYGIGGNGEGNRSLMTSHHDVKPSVGLIK